jgi:short-chain fatty acids transporter
MTGEPTNRKLINLAPMSLLAEKITRGFRRFLPSPFTIALILTLFTFILAMVLTKPDQEDAGGYLYQLMTFWEEGLWDKSAGGLYFAFQMMLMLVLGHVLALTGPISYLIGTLTQACSSTSKSVVIVSISAILLGLFNWGLALIFGALLVRKIGEKFSKEQRPVNLGLIGASAYVSMMVWHGGLSGSAPTKVMEPGYLEEMMLQNNIHGSAIQAVTFESTLGSGMNILVAILLLLLVPTFLYYLSKVSHKGAIPTYTEAELEPPHHTGKERLIGAERIDASAGVIKFIGILILLDVILKAMNYEGSSQFGFIQPNFINLALLGLALSLHRNINAFLDAVQRAIGDISGILIQFPLYFGILGIMKGSGLITVFSDALIDLADASTLPFYTFLSAGLVNFFVPSGGGQWAIQGPIIIEAVQELNGDLPKTIMAMAYGDQLTNMLQPFWALPILGITRIKAHELLPYTFMLFCLGLIVFGVVLLV